MVKRDYFLGLDIGTESVGWAVTDSDYNVIKVHGKALWGVRVFDEAKKAKDRRLQRCARRRLERRKQRIQYLQEIFSEEIAKKDPGFFRRLRESQFLEEDKQGNPPPGKFTLFSDSNYNDRDYHRDFPTIYHLRKRLIEDPAPYDVRLVYLALHHILKHRGHFLFGSLSCEEITLRECLMQFRDAFIAVYEHDALRDIAEEDLRSMLLRSNPPHTDRENPFLALFDCSSENPCYIALADLLIGRSVSVKKIFGEECTSDSDDKICLRDNLENHEDLLFSLGEEQSDFLRAAKTFYDLIRLQHLMDGHSSLSCAKVKIYDKHRQDLKSLKKLIREYGSTELYHEIFHKKTKINNYVAYAGKDAGRHRCSYDEFRQYLSSKLKELQKEEKSDAQISSESACAHSCENEAPHPSSGQPSEMDRILTELKNRLFLPKLRGEENINIPYQLHQKEMRLILRHARSYLPFLSEKDESGLTKEEQILQLLSFRLPYYVGPLNPTSRQAWIVKKENGEPEPIRPWNLENKVDLEACRENFIKRVRATCSYLGKDVLPKHSLLYSRFMVLNTINKLKINGNPISVEQKQALYNDLFLKQKKITLSQIRTFLQLEKEDELSGIDQKVDVSLSSWQHFEGILRTHSQQGQEIVEEIILRITLFGKEQGLLKNWLQRTYGNILSEEERNHALSYRCSSWGNLSKELLCCLFHCDRETGARYSIMDLLWNKNYNLAELLGFRFDFAKEIEKERREQMSKVNSLRAYLDESYASPGIKRAIHQAVSIINEVKHILHGNPRRIFLEVSRERAKDEKGERSTSRNQKLQNLYKKCKGKEYKEILAQLKNESDERLRSDKLFLYYTQRQRCMYSGTPIDLNNLNTDYDIDHIYPRSMTKDDSLDNRVLVRKELNAQKADRYPLDSSIRSNQKNFWGELKRSKLISNEKYERLMRKVPLSEEEKAGFIARQLVETRQSCKILGEWLRQNLAGSELVYVKAQEVSDFRKSRRIPEQDSADHSDPSSLKKFKQDPVFVKCREINDFHHAKDAYLNIVVGNVYRVKFTDNPLNFVKQNPKYSINRLFDFDVCRGKDRAWIAGAEGSLSTVRRQMQKNNILFTRQSKEVRGELFDLNIVPPGDGQIPIKSSDPRMRTGRYGQYNKVKGSYFCLIEYRNRKNSHVRSLEPVYLMDESLYRENPQFYFEEVLRLPLAENEMVKIIIPKIPVNALLDWDGFRMHLSGRTADRFTFKNANALILTPEWHTYVKLMTNTVRRYLKEPDSCPEKRKDDPRNLQLYEILTEKMSKMPFCVFWSKHAEKLREYSSAFADLEWISQCKILLELIKLLSCKNASADLSAMKKAKHFGVVNPGTNLSNTKAKTLFLIHTSVTGFFEQKVNLLEEET